MRFRKGYDLYGTLYAYKGPVHNGDPLPYQGALCEISRDFRVLW